VLAWAPVASAGARGLLSGVGLSAVVALLAFACRSTPDAAFTQLVDARRLAADLRVQFNKAAAASDRAVMADTDEESIAVAHEAEQTTDRVREDAAALASRLSGLAYSKEVDLLNTFDNQFKEYSALDHDILELAVENTNLKAQRLSFGPSRAAADAFRDALEAVTASVPQEERCQVEPLVAKGVVAVREIQVLQAPHIAESDDEAMTRMETQMRDLQSTASGVLETLGHRVDEKARPHLSAASDALTRFKDVSAQIVTLSRRNSNVRSLELSLRKKPALTGACDDSLRSLQEVLATEGSAGTR
jgi:hypothetical protein